MVSVCAFGEVGWVFLFNFKMSYYGASKRVFEHTIHKAHKCSKILKQKRVFEADDSDGVDDGNNDGDGDDDGDIMLMMH